MKRLISFVSIIILGFSINTYADNIVESTATVSGPTTTATQDNSVKNVLRSIQDDFDFYKYMAKKGITDDEIDKALYSYECIEYIRKELETVPEEGDISANWDIWKWHIDKIESFLENLFSSGNNYNSSGNSNSNNGYVNNNNGYNGNNNNGYNNMMPPPQMPYGNNNGWGQYPPNPPMPPNPYNRQHMHNRRGGTCNCNCNNCSNCMYK